MIDPAISKACDRSFMRKPLDGTRPTGGVRWVVLHDTESQPGSARAVAKYFQGNDGGYTHLVVDDASCYRCLENKDMARGAPHANLQGFHIEQCGYARWSAVVWGSHLGTLKRAAFKTGLHCHVFDLPPVWVDAKGLLQGKKGVTSHAEVTRAFGPKGGHTDPGLFWPRRLFMRYVNQFYDELVV